MMLKVAVLALAVSATLAAQCGVPAIPPKSTGLQNLISLLTGKSDGRIVGGVEVTPHSFPWQAALLSRVGAPTAQCGGSIITNNYILTAAHCCGVNSGTVPRPVSGMKIRVGAHDLRSTAEVFARTHNVARIVIHPKYDPFFASNDFCLVQLETPIIFNSHVSPICLSDTEDDIVGKKCVITGFGSTVQDDWGSGHFPSGVSVLRQADETIISEAQCNKIYPGELSSDMLCAFTPEKSTCQGDSGGPFVCQSAPGAPFKLVGVTSWGKGCSDKSYPASVYGKVSSALDWIAKTVSA